MSSSSRNAASDSDSDSEQLVSTSTGDMAVFSITERVDHPEEDDDHDHAHQLNGIEKDRVRLLDDGQNSNLSRSQNAHKKRPGTSSQDDSDGCCSSLLCVQHFDRRDPCHKCCSVCATCLIAVKDKWQAIPKETQYICLILSLFVFFIFVVISWAIVADEPPAPPSDGHTDTLQQPVVVGEAIYNVPVPDNAVTVSMLPFRSLPDYPLLCVTMLLRERQSRRRFVKLVFNRYGTVVDIVGTAGDDVAKRMTILQQSSIKYDTVCGGVHTSEEHLLKMDSLSKYIRRVLDGSADVLLIDGDEWTVEQPPTMAFVAAETWQDFTDCETGNIVAEQVDTTTDNAWWAKSKDKPRSLFAIVWAMTLDTQIDQMTTTVQFSEFWDKYEEIYFSTVTQTLLRAHEPEVQLLARDKAASVFPDCSGFQQEPKIRAACEALYTCSGIAVHEVPANHAWSCSCLSSTVSYLQSHRLCDFGDQSIYCLVSQWAFSRVLSLVPCVSDVECATETLSAPMTVSTNSVLVSVPVHTTFQCGHRFPGGLYAYQARVVQDTD